MEIKQQTSFLANPAGFWLRLSAKLIDGIVFAILAVIVSGITGTVFVFPILSSHSRLTVASFMPLLLWPLIACFVVGGWRHVWLLSSYRQATDGKRMFGLYVSRKDGAPVTRLQALIRYLAMYLPVVLVYALLQYTGIHMAAKFTELPNFSQTQALLNNYNDKIKTHQEPTTEERAAVEKTMENLADIVPSTSSALFLNVLQMAVLVYYLGMTGMVAFRGDKRGPHDLIANTYVFRGRLQPAVQPPKGVLLFGTPGGAWARLGTKLLSGILLFVAFIVIDRFILMRMYSYNIHREGIALSVAVLA